MLASLIACLPAVVASLVYYAFLFNCFAPSLPPTNPSVLLACLPAAPMSFHPYLSPRIFTPLFTSPLLSNPRFSYFPFILAYLPAYFHSSLLTYFFSLHAYLPISFFSEYVFIYHLLSPFPFPLSLPNSLSPVLSLPPPLNLSHLKTGLESPSLYQSSSLGVSPEMLG